MNKTAIRDSVIEYVKREFIGPDPILMDGFIQKNGEEILHGDPPRIRYSAGILYPQCNKLPDIEDSDIPFVLTSENHDLDPEIESKVSDFGLDDSSEYTDDILNLSNSFRQSSLGLTVCILDIDKVFLKVNAGKYNPVDYRSPETDKINTRYYRSPVQWSNNDETITLPNSGKKMTYYDIQVDGKTIGLRVYIIFRQSLEGCCIYTFSLVNNVQSSTSSVRDEECFFQTELSVISELGFLSLPDNPKLFANEDYLSNKLLYRKKKNYAVGHGCASFWEEKEGNVNSISTTVFPVYEMKPIVPRRFENIELNMKEFSDLGKKDNTVRDLNQLCQSYVEWIEKQEKDLSDLPEDIKSIAQIHIENCRKCYERMVDGVQLLIENDFVFKSFVWMNEAMLLQQLHYKLPLRKWKFTNQNLMILDEEVTMPDIENPDSWYNPDGTSIYGIWRPFQIAFILINLRSMLEKDCSDRGIVDLIWFPTGGGKTEAYLGLTAYTIFIRKLTNISDKGTAVIMRYTLRLLTAQQYERASSLICACEVIRKREQAELGLNRIKIGLWVGGETTPNKMSEGDDSAVKVFRELYRGQRDENPFIVLKCPWCGAQMGVVDSSNRMRKTPGYKVVNVDGRNEFVFQCANSICDFSQDNFRLPLSVIDESIYSEPPTLLIGTVDKFAMLPYLPIAQRIFGIYNGVRITTPDLIIQDELHLISGPLGSTVGLYETMINYLSSCTFVDKSFSPKIIASTATISRAKEQCHSIFGCGLMNVLQFPPQGLDAGDSFFAKEDVSAVGRVYVGIYATSTSSYAMTNIRLYSTLLYAVNALQVENESQKDPYWTNLGYFNSLRELGQTATWISADIKEYLHIIYKRRYEDKNQDYKEKRRHIVKYKELTSRISGSDIPVILQDLGVRYEGKNVINKPIDICLATNMVSVGVDVPRLGLMTVTGQPKTTSEYIQATSRVGRTSESPGLVFVVYNPSRPRDRSHYEHFSFYHSKIYAHVEPTSVTPFATPLRERALHAVLIGILRLIQPESNFENTRIVDNTELVDKITESIMRRVSIIDPDECIQTKSEITEIINLWQARNPSIFQDFFSGEIEPLMYPPNISPNIYWEDRGFKTPTSMRSVDSSCEVKVMSNRYSVEGE